MCKVQIWVYIYRAIKFGYRNLKFGYGISNLGTEIWNLGIHTAIPKFGYRHFKFGCRNLKFWYTHLVAGYTNLDWDTVLSHMTYVNQSDASFQNHCSHATPRRVHKQSCDYRITYMCMWTDDHGNTRVTEIYPAVLFKALTLLVKILYTTICAYALLP